MYHITTEQIDTFLTLAKTKNYRETSEILYITQPTVTKNIQKLEKELGKKLFHRTTQNVELTEAGRFLAESWSPLYHRMIVSIDEMNYLTERKKNVLTICVLRDYRPIEAAEYLQKEFQKYLKQKELPNIILSVRFYSMRQQRDAIQKHLVDFSISLGFDYDTIQNTDSLELAKRRVYALLPSEHPLASRSSVSVCELRDETFLVLSAAESAGINNVTISMLKKLLPDAKTETEPNFQSMAFSLRCRKGITLGNRYFVNNPDFVEVPVEELRNAVYEETLTWRTDNMTSNQLIFLDFIKETHKKFIDNPYPDFRNL